MEGNAPFATPWISPCYSKNVYTIMYNENFWWKNWFCFNKTDMIVNLSCSVVDLKKFVISLSKMNFIS